MTPILLRCHKGVGPAVVGTALVAADNFSARYDLDRTNGVFSRPGHKLAGESYVDRILVLNEAKGGVATAWMLHEMASRMIVPRALVFNRVNPILAQGAALAGMTLVDRFADGDVTVLIRTGDELHIDPPPASSKSSAVTADNRAMIPYHLLELASMPDDIAIETRIPQALDKALDRLALVRGKSKSSLIYEVLDAFVRGEEEFIAAVEEGRAAARAGELIDHDEVVGEIDELTAAGR